MKNFWFSPVWIRAVSATGEIIAQARIAGALLLSGMQHGAGAMVFLSMGHAAVMLSNGKAQLRSSPAAILEDN